MTQIPALEVQPDSVLLIDGIPYFVDEPRDLNTLDQTVTYRLRAISPEGFLAEVPLLRRFDYDELLTLKG